MMYGGTTIQIHSFADFREFLGTLTQEQAALVVGGLMLAISIAAVMMLIGALIAAAARWKLFTKAGERGWKAIIPFYSTYTQYKLTWRTEMFFVAMALGIAGSLFTGAIASMLKDGTGAQTLVKLIGSLAGIGNLCVFVVSQAKLAGAYGRDGAFTVGLVLLNPLFMLILGFGKSRYIGKQED